MTTAEGGARCPTCGQLYPPRATYCPVDGSRLVHAGVAPSVDSLVGRTLDGRYRLDALVGVGGMAAVYRGWQLSIDREVVVKVIHPQVVAAPEVEARLLSAARLACQITAAPIANTYDCSRTDDGIVYLVSEHVRGRSLAQDIAGRPLVARRAVTIAMQVLDALDLAHKAGLVHGHLSPSNVLLVDDSSRRDGVKVVDFGLAPPPGGSSELVHARYWAPEQIAQIEQRGAGMHADMYALGCILFEALSGSAPFTGATVDIIKHRHLTAEPAKLPPNVPLPLVGVVEKLLQKRPEARYRSYADVKRALEPMHAAAGTPLAGLPLPAGERLVGKAEITAMTQQSSIGSVPPAIVQQAPPPEPERGSRSRVLVIAIVAIVVSGLGIAGYLLTTG